jgi:hypothetical protein
LDWGKAAQQIIQAAEARGGDVPPLPFLETQVDREPHLAFEWEAFGELSTDRSIGFGRGPIPWSAIDRYAGRHGIDDPDEHARFVRLIRAMDEAFLGWHAERDKTDT